MLLQEFPEEHGERYFPSTKYKACDYFITLGYYLEKTAENDCIPYSNYDMNTFIDSLQDSQITIYNNLKKNKIVGYLKSVETINIKREKYSLKDWRLCTDNKEILGSYNQDTKRIIIKQKKQNFMYKEHLLQD